MFGYITVDPASLPEAQRARYEGCYCGLCRAIGERCGLFCRCTLTYDMVFLTLTLQSLYEPEETAESRPCPAHPLRKKRSWRSAASDYAADLNVMLAFHKAEDDWRDERSPVKGLEARLLRRSAAEAGERNPRAQAAISEAMALLGDVERRRDPNPDAGGNAFGAMLASLFLWRDDRWANDLRQMAHSLGRFLYLLDAVLDRDSDRKRGLYNPALCLQSDGATDEDLRDILLLLMADCTAAWERLPLVEDAELMRSILYTGVWSQVSVITGDEKRP